MAYLITCSGSKQNPTIFNPSTLEDLSFNNELLIARQEMIQLFNQDLNWNMCLPAWQLNKGRLYSRVSEQNWLKPNADIMILSALFGWIKHTDLIPDYNLTMREFNNGHNVRQIWHNQNILQQFVGNVDIDLLSTIYRNAINYGNNIPQIPNVNWRDRYGFHKGEWLNEQLNNL
ncbi:MAG: peroxide stress protein YaaA [Paludibacter sp.]